MSENADIAKVEQKACNNRHIRPYGFDLKEFRLKEPDRLKLLSLFGEFEFTSLKKLVPSVAAGRRIMRLCFLRINKGNSICH